MIGLNIVIEASQNESRLIINEFVKKKWKKLKEGDRQINKFTWERQHKNCKSLKIKKPNYRRRKRWI